MIRNVYQTICNLWRLSADCHAADMTVCRFDGSFGAPSLRGRPQPCSQGVRLCLASHWAVSVCSPTCCPVSLVIHSVPEKKNRNCSFWPLYVIPVGNYSSTLPLINIWNVSLFFCCFEQKHLRNASVSISQGKIGEQVVEPRVWLEYY